MLRMLGATVVSCLLSSMIASADDAAVVKEFKALAGEWKVVAIKDGDAEVPKEKLPSITFILRTDGTAIAKLPEGDTEAKLTLDPAKSPKTMDIVHGEGIYKGKSQAAIYTLDGDTWAILSTPPATVVGERPVDFSKGHQLIFGRVKGK